MYIITLLHVGECIQIFNKIDIKRDRHRRHFEQISQIVLTDPRLILLTFQSYRSIVVWENYRNYAIASF